MAQLVTFDNPETVLPPYGAYCHAAVVAPQGRLLFTAGEVGETVEGVVPAEIEQQYAVALDNIAKILAHHGATPANIVKLTTYLVEPIDPGAMRRLREAAFGDISPAATLLYVPRLAGPQYLVEIEAVAALP